MTSAVVLLMAGLLFSRDFSKSPRASSVPSTTRRPVELARRQGELRYWPVAPRGDENITFEPNVARWPEGQRPAWTDPPRPHRPARWFGGIAQPCAAECGGAAAFLRSACALCLAAQPHGLIEAVSGSFGGLNQLSGARLTLSKARVTIGAEGDSQRLVLEPGRSAAALPCGVRSHRHPGTTGFKPATGRDVRLLPTLRALQGGSAQSASLRLSGFGSRATFNGIITRKPELMLQGEVDASIQNDFERLMGITLSRAGADVRAHAHHRHVDARSAWWWP